MIGRGLSRVCRTGSPGQRTPPLRELGAASGRPADLDVRDEAGGEDEIHRPFAEDLTVEGPRRASMRTFTVTEPRSRSGSCNRPSTGGID